MATADGMVVCHLPYGPTAYFSLQNVVMRHDVKEFTSTMSEQFPHLIFNNFSTPLGQRVWAKNKRKREALSQLTRLPRTNGPAGADDT